MAEPIETWRQAKIENLRPGDSWGAETSFTVHRYKDGWYFYWNYVNRSKAPCLDIARFFDEESIMDMRRFMDGDWTKGKLVWGPKPEELIN